MSEQLVENRSQVELAIMRTAVRRDQTVWESKRHGARHVRV